MTLSGYKTYLCAAAGVAILVVNALGFIPDHTRDELLNLVGFAGLAALRAAVGRV